LAGFGASIGSGSIIAIGARNIFEIVFEPLSDCFRVLSNDQSLAMSQHERGLVAQANPPDKRTRPDLDLQRLLYCCTINRGQKTSFPPLDRFRFVD
jgi:hypothetical protein